VTRRII